LAHFLHPLNILIETGGKNGPKILLGGMHMGNYLTWEERYNIGIEIIDREHRKLFSILNKLFRFGHTEEKSRFACQEAIKYFKEHAVQHFADEEAYMASIHYPGLGPHRRIHKDFRERMLPALESELELTHFSHTAIQHFLCVCAGWLIGHTLIEDHMIVSGEPVRHWENLLPQDEQAVMGQTIAGLLHSMFRLDSQLISSCYSGEKFGDEICCRLIYRGRDKKRMEFFLLFEEQLIGNTIGNVIDKKSETTDIMLCNIAKYAARQLVERVKRHFPSLEQFVLISEHVLSYEQFYKMYERLSPRFSLLFDTGQGYFACCMAASETSLSGEGISAVTKDAVVKIESRMHTDCLPAGNNPEPPTGGALSDSRGYSFSGGIQDDGRGYAPSGSGMNDDKGYTLSGGIQNNSRGHMLSGNAQDNERRNIPSGRSMDDSGGYTLSGSLQDNGKRCSLPGSLQDDGKGCLLPDNKQIDGSGYMLPGGSQAYDSGYLLPDGSQAYGSGYMPAGGNLTDGMGHPLPGGDLTDGKERPLPGRGMTDGMGRPLPGGGMADSNGRMPSDDGTIDGMGRLLSGSDPESTDRRKKKILVVDDSDFMRTTLLQLLGDDYDVLTADSGISAIRSITLVRPDLVLLDYEMPVCSGSQVLEMIRSEKDFTDIPVIFLTCRRDKQSVQKAISLKPEGYLSKSLSAESVKSEIDRFFEKSGVSHLRQA